MHHKLWLGFLTFTLEKSKVRCILKSLLVPLNSLPSIVKLMSNPLQNIKGIAKFIFDQFWSTIYGKFNLSNTILCICPMQTCNNWKMLKCQLQSSLKMYAQNGKKYLHYNKTSVVLLFHLFYTFMYCVLICGLDQTTRPESLCIVVHLIVLSQDRGPISTRSSEF